MNYISHGDFDNKSTDSQNKLEQAMRLITERAKQLVDEIVQIRGKDSPPFSPKEYSQFLGIKKIESVDLGNTSGVLIRLSDGYIINVNKKHNKGRQAFSIAHEIGHILFSELKLENHIKSIEYRTYNPQALINTRYNARERLCDVAATELLMPESVFQKYLFNFGLSISVVERMADIFQVSLSAAIKRISEVSKEPCIALVWRPQKYSKNLRLIQVSGPKKNEKYLPMHTNVKCPSLLHKALDQHIRVKSNYSFIVGREIKRLPMESKGFGSKDFKCVVSLALLNG
jgi:Zn-dependent peptidase ImmA (M78 family)